MGLNWRIGAALCGLAATLSLLSQAGPAAAGPEEFGIVVTAGAVPGCVPDIADEADCTACDMPARRPQDVTAVWMTDHRNQRGGAPAVPPLPLAKTPVEVSEVVAHGAPDTLPDRERTRALALSILSYTGGTAEHATDALGRILSSHPPADAGPWLVFAEAALRLNANDLAFRAAQEARVRAPDQPVAVKLMGLARLQQGDLETARLLTERSLDLSAAMAEQHVNLALIHRTNGDDTAALAGAHRALEKSHVLWRAGRLIGEIETRRGNLDAAARALAAALAIEPDADRVRPALVGVLTALGRTDEAARHAALIPVPVGGVE